MVVVFAEQQHAALAHELNNLRIRFKDRETREVLHFCRELARVVDRAINLQPIFSSQHEIVVTVPGRGVHATSTGFAGRGFRARLADIQFSFGIGFASECDVLSEHQK